MAIRVFFNRRFLVMRRSPRGACSEARCARMARRSRHVGA
jgi:hypothetical protein